MPSSIAIASKLALSRSLIDSVIDSPFRDILGVSD